MTCCQCKKCGECGKPYSSNSTYAEICKDFEKKKMTNFEKVKAMSIDEMARSTIPFFLFAHMTHLMLGVRWERNLKMTVLSVQSTGSKARWKNER